MPIQSNKFQPVRPASLESGPSILTGIPAVDEALQPLLDRGGLILVGGYTGGGKTTLACQIAAQLVSRAHNVRYLSAEPEEDEVIARMLSSMVPWPMEKLWDALHFEYPGEDVRIALDRHETPAFTAGALPHLRKIDKHLDFHYRDDFPTKPLEALDEVLAGPPPSCLIVDYLRFNGASLMRDGSVVVRLVTIAKQVVERLKEYAHVHRIPVVVLCQLKPEPVARGRKTIAPNQIADFPSIDELADGFVGISQLSSSHATVETEGTFARAQYLTVRRGKTARVPVTTDLGFQRFLPRIEGEDKSGDSAGVGGAHVGFVRMKRAVLSAIADLHYPPALNVYVYLLLRANYQKGSQYYGTTYVGRDKISEDLNLSENQVRAALDKLYAADLVHDTGKKKGRAAVRRINDDFEGEVGNAGFFMLARNLLDTSRAQLLGDPVLFRTWIAVISLARHSPSPDGEIDRGHLRLEGLYEMIAGITHDPLDKVDGAMEALDFEGRISLKESPFGTQTFKVTNYERYQSGKNYRRQSVLPQIREGSECGPDEDQQTSDQGPTGDR